MKSSKRKPSPAKVEVKRKPPVTKRTRKASPAEEPAAAEEPETPAEGSEAPAEEPAASVADPETQADESEVEAEEGAAEEGEIEGDAPALAEEPEAAAESRPSDESSSDAPESGDELSEAAEALAGLADVIGEDGEPASAVGLVGDAEGEATDEGSVTDTTAFLKGLVEAILFVSDHPLEPKEIARAARIDKKRALELAQELVVDTRERGIRVEEVAGGFIFRSSPTYSAYVRNFLQQRPVRLSRPQLETLSIVAYRQPITRPEIDDIRGVDSGPVLKGLLERDLIRIIGKKDEPGRPMLYGTTPVFLEAFSLKSLSELPTLREYTELTDESRRDFEEKTGEIAPEGPLATEPPPSLADSDLPAADSTAPESSALDSAEEGLDPDGASDDSEEAPTTTDESANDSNEDDDSDDDDEDDDSDDDDEDDDSDEDDEDDDDDDDDEDDDSDEDDEDEDDDDDDDEDDDSDKEDGDPPKDERR